LKDPASELEKIEHGLWRHRIVLAATATTVLLLLVLVPFAVGDAVGDLLGPPEGRVYRLSSVSSPPPPGAAHLHLGIVGVSELQQTLTVRVTGHYDCAAACDWTDRLVLVALRDDEADGFPPAVTVALPRGDPYVNQSVDLPARGHASRYPFDKYRLKLGVVWQRTLADGTVQTLAPPEAPAPLSLTLQEEVARMFMPDPAPVPPQMVGGDGERYRFVAVADVVVERPLYLRILAVLLVLLVALASAYAVFMRPLNDLVLNAGALVLGIWGVRAILVPMPWTWLTAVDLSLSVVIIFLLGAITVRAFVYAFARSGFRHPKRRKRA
jgi:hypothetical protein